MRRARIQLVEDDDKMAGVYQAHLEQAGYEVRRSSDGEAALSDVKEFKPDIIILDIMIPKMDGFDTLAALRMDPDTKHTKIMILSALDAIAYQQKGKELGTDDYMVKASATVDDVVNRIQQHLSEMSLEGED